MPQLLLAGHRRGARAPGGRKTWPIRHQRYAFGGSWVIVGQERKGKVIKLDNGTALVDIGLGKGRPGFIRGRDVKKLRAGEAVTVHISRINEIKLKPIRGRRINLQIDIELKFLSGEDKPL